MRAAGLQVDFASVGGDCSIAIEGDALRRAGNAFIGGFGGMAHHAARADHVLGRIEMRVAGKALECGGDGTCIVLAAAEHLRTVESHMIKMKMMAVRAQVQVGLPLRAWVVLNQWRIVTPMRKTSAAMIQLYFVPKASDSGSRA